MFSDDQPSLRDTILSEMRAPGCDYDYESAKFAVKIGVMCRGMLHRFRYFYSWLSENGSNCEGVRVKYQFIISGPHLHLKNVKGARFFFF